MGHGVPQHSPALQKCDGRVELVDVWEDGLDTFIFFRAMLYVIFGLLKRTGSIHRL